MLFPEERVDDVCRLTPSQALELLDKGRAGDAESLAAWSIRAVYRQLLKSLPPSAAVHHTKVFARTVELDVKVVS